MDSYDVVIVGAGLAGLQCARLLGSARLSVLLVDQKRSVGEKVHTTGIFVRKTLEDFPIPDDCLGPPVRRVSLYAPSGRRMDLNSPHVEFRVGRMAELYTRWLRVSVSSGVEWRARQRMIEIEREDSGSIITLESRGIRSRVRTRFVIGADGAASPAARLLGLSRNRDWIVGVEDVYEDHRDDVEPQFHCFLDPRIAPGYLGWIVQDGVETHVGVGGYAHRFDPAESLTRFKSRARLAVDLSAAAPIERRGGRIPVGGVLPHIANRWGLLVGDAAGAVSPLTAGGLDPCLRLSTLAARVAMDYLEHGSDCALADYDGCRFRSHFKSRLWLRRLLNGIRHPTQMEIACLALRTPPFRALAWKVFFGRGSFPDVDAASPNILAAET